MSSHSAKRTQLTISLVVVLIALVALIAWMELAGKSADSPSVKKIDRIVITRKGHSDITLVRDGSAWQITTPVTVNANAQRIEPLLSVGQSPFDGYKTTEVDLPATGLTQPAASITFDERTFLLGNVDSGGDRRYATADNKVGFVPAWVWSLVHGGVTAFADLAVFPALPDTLYLVDGDSVQQLAAGASWQALQADKIIPWTGNFEDSEAGKEGFRFLILRTTADEKTGEIIATITRTSEYAAISTKPGFAYAISNARLDALLKP